MKSTFLILLASLRLVSALDLPPGGTPLGDSEVGQAYVGKETGAASKSGDGWRIDVARPEETKAYAAQLSVPLKDHGFGPDDLVIAVIKARVHDGTRGNLIAKLQQSTPNAAACDQTSFAITSEWTEYPILFRPKITVEKGNGSLAIFAGHRKQNVEIESVRAIRYPASTDIAALPRIRHTYPGRDVDAPWRVAALERIENGRKKDLSFSLTGSDGKPLADQKVSLVLKRHEFGFGSAIPAATLMAAGPDGDKFRETVDRLFSTVTFENDLKDYEWAAGVPPDQKAKFLSTLDQAITWLEGRKISIRGHYLMQSAVPPNLAEEKDPAKIREHFITITNERLDFVKDRVFGWDVINHPVAWPGADMLTARPGLEKLDREIFALAREKTRVPFFINEDQIFRPSRQSDETFNYIKALDADGFKVAGLGNQSHFHASGLPSPEEMLAVTDRFAKIVPSQAITEFDIDTEGDETLAADFTRDTMIACFSHPAYDAFVLWGFWEGMHWKKECASWNQDWSVRERGKVLEEWIGKRWRTEVSTTTDADGKIQWRGFPGWYEALLPGNPEPVMIQFSTARPDAGHALSR